MIHIKHQLEISDQRSLGAGKTKNTCLDCSSVISSDAFIPLSVINLPMALKGAYGLQPRQDVPSDHFTSSLPILTTFEPCVASDKFLKNRMKLIFSTQAKLYRVHKGDEALGRCQPRLSEMNGCGETCVVSATHFPVSGPASLECSTVAGTPTVRR